MKIHSPSFEKALRRGVKKAVKASPALKRERKRLGPLRRNYSVNWIIRPLCAGFLGAIAGTVTVQTGHLVTGLAVINLWMLGALWFQSNGIKVRLYRSADMGALALLPVSNDRIFRWQSQKCLRHFLLVLLDLSVAFEVQAYLAHFSPAQWVAAFGLAILSWIVLIALATFHAARFSRSPLPGISLALSLAVMAFFCGRSVIGPMLMRILDQVAPQLNVVLPTGWPVSLFRLLGPEPRWWTLILLLPVAVVIATLPDSVKRLRGRMRFHEHVIEPAMDLIPGEDAGEVKKQTSRPVSPKQLGPTAIEEVILSRIMFCPPTWPHRGWMERWLWRRLSPREQVLADFAFPAGLNLTRSWKTLFRNLAFAVAVAFAVGIISFNGKLCVLMLGLFVTGCHALGLVSMAGRVFQRNFASGVNISLYAGFGLGFRELSRMLLKYSAVQLPFLLVFGTVGGLVTGWLTGLPVGYTLIIGCKAGILLFAARYILLAVAFSSTTSQSRKFVWRSLATYFGIFTLGLAFAGFAGCGLFLPDHPAVAWLLFAAALVDAYAIFRLYEWYYIRGRIDLMSLPPRQ